MNAQKHPTFKLPPRKHTLEGDANGRVKKYVILRSIGKGSFGHVKEAMHVISQEKIAIKILEKVKIHRQADLTRVEREMAILAKLTHPNIIQLYENIETSKYYFFVMEYALQGELTTHIKKKKRLKEPEACRIFQQLISGVEYMHKMGIVHRDLKPANILLDEHKNVKIIDFGLGNLYDNSEKLNTSCGSPCYAAPELIAGEEYNPLKVDIWSCGIVLYYMVAGYLPFNEGSKAEL